MRIVRVVRGLIVAVSAGLMLTACMGGPGPVATAQPDLVRGDLDTIAYGAAQPAVAAQPTAYAEVAQPVSYEGGYRLDAGDRLRIVVYGQDGLTNSYGVDAGGMITMPLIGAVHARGLTPAELARAVAAKLRGGYIREPYVAAEVEAYRPFFILGEVAAPGQYPYVPNMTVESAVAIAGGFTPRARRSGVQLTRANEQGATRALVPTGTPVHPGDSIVVGERWF